MYSVYIRVMLLLVFGGGGGGKKSYTRSDLLVKMAAYPLYFKSKCHIII